MMADAALVKYDSNTGIAIISVDKSLLDDATIRAIAVAELGNSNIVSRGASVIALEANYAILTGLVTSTTNELSAQDNNYSVLTTDIASNKLQSGILINTDGQVIGLSLQDFNPAEENNTLTAVSISDLSPVIEKLESGADVPYIGITCTTVTEKIANRYNIPKVLYKAGYHGFTGICLGASKRRCDSCGKQYRGVECVRVQHTAYEAKA